MATFGRTGIGANIDAMSDDLPEGCRFQMNAENGTATSITLYTVDAGIDFVVGLYSDAAGPVPHPRRAGGVLRALPPQRPRRGGRAGADHYLGGGPAPG